MPLRKLPAQRFAAAALMILMAIGARAQDIDAPAPARRQTQPVDQLIYRGVVGNVLESVPLDPDRRVELQRANAVVTNTLSGRTLAVLMGVATPVLMIGGLAWGVFAASRIKPTKPAPVAAPAPVTELSPARPGAELAALQD